MKGLIRKMLRKAGIQVKRYPDPDLARRMKLVSRQGIDTLLDVGANAGQYAIQMRELGYRGRIISFEPLKSAFEELKKASSKDGNWTVNRYAIGDEDVRGVIHVAGNSQSSSIADMLPTHLQSAPESRYVAREEIEIRKLDSVFSSFCHEENRVMMKIDTQGYEKNVIDGAAKSLNRVRVVQLEMSICPLYENELLFMEMIHYLDGKGFRLFSLENGFSDPATGRLLQVDGIFENNAFAPA